MIGSDEGIKIGLFDGKVNGTILGNVDGITIGVDVGTDLGSLDGSFDGFNVIGVLHMDLLMVLIMKRSAGSTFDSPSTLRIHQVL